MHPLANPHIPRPQSLRPGQASLSSEPGEPEPPGGLPLWVRVMGRVGPGKGRVAGRVAPAG